MDMYTMFERIHKTAKVLFKEEITEDKVFRVTRNV